MQNRDINTESSLAPQRHQEASILCRGRRQAREMPSCLGAYAVSAHIQTALIALARLVVSGKSLKP